MPPITFKTHLTFDLTKYVEVLNKVYFPALTAYEGACREQERELSQLASLQPKLLQEKIHHEKVHTHIQGMLMSGNYTSPKLPALKEELKTIERVLHEAMAEEALSRKTLQEKNHLVEITSKALGTAQLEMYKLRNSYPIEGSTGQLVWAEIKEQYLSKVSAQQQGLHDIEHLAVATELCRHSTHSAILLDSAMNEFFVELVKNSLDAVLYCCLEDSSYSPEVTIECGFTIVDGQLTFNFSDNGPGFPAGFSEKMASLIERKDYLTEKGSPKISDPFSFGGRGLGLNCLICFIKEGTHRAATDTATPLQLELPSQLSDIRFSTSSELGGAEIVIECPKTPLRKLHSQRHPFFPTLGHTSARGPVVQSGGSEPEVIIQPPPKKNRRR